MKYTKELLTKVFAESISVAAVMRSLEVKPSGGLHHHLLQKAKRWGISTSHFRRISHLKGKTHSWAKKRPIEEWLTANAKVNRTSLKRRLLQEGILKNICGGCGQPPIWNGKRLVMVLDHINGVNDDYRRENLQLLCPNCNSQTDTFCGRNRKIASDQRVLAVVGEIGIRAGTKELKMKERSIRLRLQQLRERTEALANGPDLGSGVEILTGSNPATTTKSLPGASS